MNLHALQPEPARRLVNPLDRFRLEPPEGEMPVAVSGSVDFVTITDVNGFRVYEGPVGGIADSNTFTIMWDALGIWSIS